MPFEHLSHPLLSTTKFMWRIVKHVALSFGIIAVALGIGVVGYHVTENYSWLDALLNASMILAGMGQIDPIRTDAGKWFASFYAIFSGVIFLATASIVMAPIIHRALHRLHLDKK